MPDSTLQKSAESASLLTMPWSLAISEAEQVEVEDRWRLLGTFTSVDGSRQSLAHHILLKAGSSPVRIYLC